MPLTESAGSDTQGDRTPLLVSEGTESPSPQMTASPTSPTRTVTVTPPKDHAKEDMDGRSPRGSPSGTMGRRDSIARLAEVLPLRGLDQPTTKAAVLRLSLLFGLDAFAGGLVIQSYLAWWFHTRWDIPHTDLGRIFFFVNIASGLSGLGAGFFVRRIGAIRTMVFTQIPSNVLMFLVPLMPSPFWGVAMLVARYSISQMDIPARQAYVAALVAPHERSAAGGWTNTARSIFVAGAPFLLTAMGSETAAAGSFAFNFPFFACAVLKSVYNAAVYVTFDGGKQPGVSSPKASPAAPPPLPAPATERTSLLHGAVAPKEYGGAAATSAPSAAAPSLTAANLTEKAGTRLPATQPSADTLGSDAGSAKTLPPAPAWAKSAPRGVPRVGSSVENLAT